MNTFKKAIIFSFGLIFVTQPVFAATLDQSNTVTPNDGYVIHYNNSDLYAYGTGLEPGITGTLNSVHLRLSRWYAGLTNCHVFVKIYNSSSDLPNLSSQVGGNSDSVHSDDLAVWNTATEVTFTWSSNSPNLNSGTKYWIVVDSDGGISTTNGVVLHLSSTAGSNNWTIATAHINAAYNSTGLNSPARYAWYKTYMDVSVARRRFLFNNLKSKFTKVCAFAS